MKPIIFSTPMVRAILDNRKKQTRRVMKPQPDKLHKYFNGFVTDSTDRSLIGCAMFSVFEDGGCNCKFAKLPYRPGDIIWVRETWAKRIHSDNRYYYKADNNLGAIFNREDDKWRSPIFMPREAARIFLRVTNVRVERLQDITEEDARSEGVKDPYEYQSPEYYEQPNLRGFEINKSAFAGCWDSIYSKRGYGWDTNPWVWVYEFEKISRTGGE